MDLYASREKNESIKALMSYRTIGYCNLGRMKQPSVCAMCMVDGL